MQEIYYSRNKWIVLILLGVIISFTGCAACPVWNDLFNRGAGVTYGWESGDGAYTIELPNNRVLWLFGDTFVRDINGNEHMPRNTIGIHPGRPDGALPDRKDLRFYARDGNNNMIDVTYRDNIPAQAIRAWADPTGWLWPKDGVMIGGSLVVFYDKMRCTEGKPPGCAGNWSWEKTDTYVLIINNPQDDVTRWHLSLQPMNVGKEEWGCAVYYDKPHLYVFGIDENSNGRLEKYLVDSSNVNNYFNWVRLGVTKNIGKNFPTEFSVDKVTLNGMSRYVMVHQRIILSYDAVVRVSESLEHWPDDVRGQDVWTGDLRTFDRDLTGDQYIWAVKGHAELARERFRSMGDSAPPSCRDCMLLSYYSQQLNRLRFLCFPLLKIQPWRPAPACGDCWN